MIIIIISSMSHQHKKIQYTFSGTFSVELPSARTI